MDASDNNNKIKLLLHSEDGFIPFLTPYLLNKYFSPNLPLIQNHFIIGMAVKDTCIVPVFGGERRKNGNNVDDGTDDSSQKKKNKKKEKKKRKVMDKSDKNGIENEDGMNHSSAKRLRHDHCTGSDKSSNMEVVTTTTTTSSSSNTPPPQSKEGEKDKSSDNKNNNKNDMNAVKPTGYQFESQFHEKQLSSLIAPGYKTMTVPTFDLVDDIMNFSNKKTNKGGGGGGKNSQYGKKNSNGKNKNVNNQSDDNTANLPPISSSNNQITLCTPHGMQKLSIETYIKITSELKTNSFVGLFDQAHINDKKKRKSNSIARTKLYMNQIVEQIRKKNETNDKKSLWSPLICTSTSSNYNDNDEKNNESGTDKSRTFTDLNKVLEEVISTQKDCISGITLVGWHHIQSQKEQMEVLQHCTNFLQKEMMSKITSPPSQLECAVLATKNLKQIMDATKFRVNVFGCDLPTRWARSGKALALSLKRDAIKPNSGDNESQSLLDENGCIDLSDSKYCRDKLPLLPECECFETYTRSYIHHLIEAKELLADIILFAHNLHQMLLLCRELSQAKEDGKIEEYCEFIEKQLG